MIGKSKLNTCEIFEPQKNQKVYTILFILNTPIKYPLTYFDSVTPKSLFLQHYHHSLPPHPVFFFSPKNMKSARETNLWPFFGFFSGENYFSCILLSKFTRSFRSFLWQIFRFFSVHILFFLGRNLRILR